MAKVQRIAGSIPVVKTTCTQCGARYSLSDDKARPGARIRCRKCGAAFVTRPAQTEAPRSLRSVAQAAVDQSGTRPGSGSHERDASALFSLAALAHQAVDRPSSAGSQGEREDSDLIDLAQLRHEAREATVTPIPTAIPLLPLGLNPLGTPLPDVSGSNHTPAEPVVRPWLLVAGSIAVATIILGAAFATRGGTTPHSAPAAAPSVQWTNAARPAESTPSAPAPVPSASETPAETASASPPPSAVVRPAPTRPPPPPPPPRDDPPQHRDSPRDQPVNRCAHCGNDLRCSIECRVK